MKKITFALLCLSVLYAGTACAGPVNTNPTVEEAHLVKFAGKSWTPVKVGWNWEQDAASDNCRRLKADGKTGFRLPTEAELTSFLRAGKLVVVNNFDRTPHDIWTATEGESGYHPYRRCSFSGTCMTETRGNENGEVICVRDDAPTTTTEKKQSASMSNSRADAAAQKGGKSTSGSAPALTLTTKTTPGITAEEINKLDAENKKQLAAKKALIEKETAEGKVRQGLEDKKLAEFKDSQKRHICVYTNTLTGNAYVEADAKAKLRMQTPGTTGNTPVGDPYKVISATSTCVKEASNINPEYKCVGKQTIEVSLVGPCGSNATSKGISR